MNDKDWFKKFRRGSRGGCTLFAGLIVGVVVMVGILGA